jgi:hypothetical protein
MPRLLKFRVRYIIEANRGALVDWGYLSQFNVGKGCGRTQSWPYLHADEGVEHHWPIHSVHQIAQGKLKFGSYPGAMQKPQFDWIMCAEDIADMIDGGDMHADAIQIWTASVDKPAAVVIGTIVYSRLLSLFDQPASIEWASEYDDHHRNRVELFIRYIWEFPYQLDAESWRTIKSGFQGQVQKFSKGSNLEIQAAMGTEHYFV